MGKKSKSKKHVDGFDRDGKDHSPMDNWAKAVKKGKYAKTGAKEPMPGAKDPKKC